MKIYKACTNETCDQKYEARFCLPSDRFCIKCGQPLHHVCKKCKRPIEDNDLKRYCDSCILEKVQKKEERKQA